MKYNDLLSRILITLDNHILRIIQFEDHEIQSLDDDHDQIMHPNKYVRIVGYVEVV